MLRIYHDRRKQPDIFEASLPKELFELDEELKGIDTLLDAEDFLAPFLEEYPEDTGRPTVPVESYLRMMYLKFRYELGYESLTRAVSDSIKWRTFCKFKLGDSIPDPTTLRKTAQRLGEEALGEKYNLLLTRAREQKILRKPRPPVATLGKAARPPRGGNIISDSLNTLKKTMRTLQHAGSQAVSQIKGRPREEGEASSSSSGHKDYKEKQ